MERISRMRNRMRESCSSGSVGGEGGNRLAYPAIIGHRQVNEPFAAPTTFPLTRSGT
jgi:hypothetical protein